MNVLNSGPLQQLLRSRALAAAIVAIVLVALAYVAPAGNVGAVTVVSDGNVDSAYEGRFIDVAYEAKDDFVGRFAFVETEDAYYIMFIQDPRAKSNAYCSDTKSAPGCSQKFGSLVGSDYIGFTWTFGGREIFVPVDTISESAGAPSGYESVMGEDGGDPVGISASALEGHSGIDYSLNVLGWRDFNNSPNFAGQPSHPFIYANQAEVRIDKAAGQLADGLNFNNVTMDAHNSPNSSMPPNVPTPTPTPTPTGTPTPTPTPTSTPTPTPTITPSPTPSLPPGSVEIDKIYCPVGGSQHTTFEVFGPGQGSGTPGQDAIGCRFGDAKFTIYDSRGNVAFNGSVGADGILELSLAPGAYTIYEVGVLEFATFEIRSGQLSAVVVTNYFSGLVKVIKYFCPTLHDPNVVFVIQGQGNIPSKSGCVTGNATFRIDQGAWFSLADDGSNDGMTMRSVIPGTHTLTELYPNQATSGQFQVGFANPLDGLSDGEVTTIFVFDYGTSIPTPTPTTPTPSPSPTPSQPTPTPGQNASISGNVYLASNASVLFPGNGPISGVTVQLFNASTAQLVAQTQTDGNGHYIISNIPAGSYYLHEVQPAGPLSQGGIFPGSAGGFAAQVDLILGINLGAGVNATNYNFSEIPGTPISPTPTPPVTPSPTPPVTPSPTPPVTPSPTPPVTPTPGQNTLTGCVYTALNASALYPGTGPISGVTIHLLNSNTLAVVASTVTGANGCYSFSNVPTGSYIVREFQPNGYNQGGIFPCNGAGTAAPVDLILGVNISGGSNIGGCNYSEIVPGATPSPSPTPPCACPTPTPTNPPTPTASPTPPPTPSPSPTPCSCETPQPNGSISGHVYSAGNATTVFPGNGPIAGVTIELHRSSDGQLLALVQTNANGSYTLPNVAAGSYFLREVQPNGYSQGGIFPGSVGGSASAVDLILGINLGAGVSASNYNFSEIPDGSSTPTPSPTPTNSATPSPNTTTCLTNRPDLTMVEISNSSLVSLLVNGTGVFGDGTVSINVNNFNGHTFNWFSNIGISSVFARTATGGALFEYNPAVKAANGIGTTTSITFLSFCYKVANGPTATPTLPNNPTPTPTLPDTTVAAANAASTSTGGALLAGALIVVLAAALALGSGWRRNRRTVKALAKPMWSTGSRN